MTVQAATLAPSAFLHLGDERIYQPLTDRSWALGEPGFPEALAFAWGKRSFETLSHPVQERLQREGWTTEEGQDESTRYLLKYVSLEAHTVCNQACYFCPVSVDPRASHFMSSELYASILDQLAAFRSTIESVFMINYNEPTADARFVEQVRAIKAAGLPPSTLTNGTGLTPDRVDAIVAMGGLRYLSVNLSTLDRERYRRDRGKDQLPLVLRNLEYAQDKELAPEMDIVVLGQGDEVHQDDARQIAARFAGTRFRVKSFEVMDRAGYLELGLKQQIHGKLAGCENIGSRPLQHLHITPHGKCVLCCEDYDERYEVGDLTRQSVREVLEGETMARLRRWAYGVEEAPEDFLCRRCVFARACSRNAS
jgi:radical SAM protein with 4Fe4S-binding SPASM domain